MEILYKAIDGKIFDNKWECEKYENTLECEELKGSLLWWDNEQKPIPVCENADPLYYFYIKSEEAVEYMEKVIRDYGWSCEELEVGGMYYYNTDEESFCIIANQIDYYEDKISELRKIRGFMWERGRIMIIKCPHCESSFGLSHKFQIDHEVEIVDNCAEIYDTYVCPHCKGCVGVKQTSGKILDWYSEVELL